MLEDLFAPQDPPPVQPKVLFACTGNICRSPLAEVLLEQELARNLPGVLTVASAGVRAVVGAGLDDFPKQYAASADARTEHEARQFDEQIAQEVGLVLVMTEHQRQWVGYQFPTVARRVFSLRWFVQTAQRVLAEQDLPDGDFATRFSWLLDQAARQRSTFEDLRDFDVQDPYRQPEQTHREVAELISAQVVQLVKVLSALGAHV